MARNQSLKKKRKPLRWFLLGVGVLLLGVGMVLLTGLPGGWVSGLLNGVEGMPGRVEMKELQWHPPRGLKVHEVSWFSPRDLTRPLLTADQVMFKPAYGENPNEITLVNGSLVTDIGVWTRDLNTRQPVRLTELSGQVHWDQDRIRFQQVQWFLSGLEITLQGELTLTPSEEGVVPETFDEKIGRILRPLVPVLRGLQNFSSELRPELSLNVSGGSGNPTIAFSLTHPHAFELRGASFRSFEVSGRLEDRLLTIETMEVRTDNNESLVGTSEINFRNERFEVTLTNSLGRRELEALSPVSLDKFLSTLDLRVEGQPNFRLNIGPSSFDKPAQNVSGSFEIAEGFYRDAFFQKAVFDLQLEGSHLQLPGFTATVGDEAGSGEIQGDLELDTKTGLFRVSLVGAADPDQAISLVGPNVEAILREWEFNGSPPEVRLEIHKEDRETPMRLNLIAKAEDAVWRGTLFDQITAVTTLDNQGLRIRDLLASRGQHTLEGSLSFPRSLSSCTFTLESSFPLPDVLPLLGQGAMDVIQPIRFQGATEFSTSGIVDLSGKHQHRLSGEASFEDVVFRWILFNKLTTSFILEGQQLELPDIQGQLVEGSLEGNLQLQNTFQSDGTFRTGLNVRKVDLFELITKATDRPTTPYTGTLDLNVEVEGALRNMAEKNRLSTLQGKGEITIRDGQLFRIPLLLGLSNILSKIVMGFGYASQGDFDADFVIKNGRFSSEELFLGGSVISIAGTGAYDLVSREIDGNLKIQLLKDGLMSDALRVLLWPIRKLIEVQLTGTIDEPDWRPRNLPKELFGK